MKTHLKKLSDEGKQRQTENDKLTIKERITKLDKRLGIGIGAMSERKRLTVQLEELQSPKSKTAIVTVLPFDPSALEITPKIKAKERRIADKEVQHKSKL
jgi:hypothetical protein